MASILIVTALLVVPGIGAALAVSVPEQASLETRGALAIGLGYVLVAGVATALTLAHVLSQPTFICGVVMATVVVWTVAFRRASPHAHARAMLAQIRQTPFVLFSELVVLIAVALTWPLYPPANNFEQHAPWRYWADGLEIAAAGRVPPTTGQWGSEFPTTVSKLALNSFEAGSSFVVGPDPLTGMRALLTVAAIAIAATLMGVGRELGLRVVTPLVPVLVMLVPGKGPIAKEFAGDLQVYKAENLGRVAALTALLLGIFAVTRARSKILALVAGGIFALAALTHGVSAVVAIAAFGLYVGGIALVDRVRWRQITALGAIVVAASAAGYLGMLLLSGGDLGFQRVASTQSFPGFPSDIDPTRSLDQGRVVRIRPRENHFFIQPGRIASKYAETTVGGRSAGFGFLVLGFLAAATVVVVVVARLIPLAVVSWGLVGMFLSGALLFSYRYDTQIPGDFGIRRLYDYAILPIALIVPALIEVVALWLFRRRPLILGGVSLVVAALAIPAAISRIPHQNPQRSQAATVFSTVATTVPCGARMLPNARSAGVWEAMTGRRSVLEGVAPYLRPEIMKQVLPNVLSAKEFFRDPRANEAFLVRHGIEYIVVIRPKLRPGTLGPYPTDESAIESLPGLQKLADSGQVKVFAVGSNTATQPTPRRCPL